MAFRKLKIRQAVELGGAGYSPVGGPGGDGVYLSVPAEALKDNWHFEALVKEGAIEDLGAGQGPEDLVADLPKEHMKVAQALGHTPESWMQLAPVERDAQVQAFNDRVGRQAQTEAQNQATDLMASAGASNAANAVNAAETRAAEAKAANAAAARAAEQAKDAQAAQQKEARRAQPAAKKTAAAKKP